MRISKEFSSYQNIATEIRKNGYKRIVFTNGCFDVIHPGHIQLLEKARNLAGPKGAVVVGVNDDESVKRLKGPERPVFDVNSRALILTSLRTVDHVVTFEEDTPLILIEALRPDLIIKGGDYKRENVVGSHLAPVVIADYDPTWSTTRLINKVKNS